jgi:hypothetical protein
MANTDYAHGFACLGRNLGGGEPMIKEFTKLASLGQAWFRNDRLFPVNDGSLTRTNTPGTTQLAGINLNYSATSTLCLHKVIISPDALFEAQSDDDVTGLVATNRWNNCNAIDGTGDANTRMGKDELNTDTADVTAALDWKLLGLFEEEGNAFGQFARFVCVSNLHVLNTRATGV